MSGVAASIQATKSSPKKLKKSKKEKKSKKDKKKKEKKEKKAKKAKKKEESSDSDSDDDALSISDLKQKAKEIVSNGSQAKESTVGKKRRASFAEPLEDGSPRKKKKKVSASDDMPSRPRTRSFDKGQKKMSGKDGRSVKRAWAYRSIRKPQHAVNSFFVLKSRCFGQGTYGSRRLGS